ncbi:hypothetical protein [Clostridium sp.]|uniref:hypothetical protein n=1 Tax=Clostridium sp. TaxID=1506 RepID=UPI002FDC99DC
MKIDWGSTLRIVIITCIVTYLLHDVTLYDIVSCNPKLSVVIVLLFVVFMLMVSICGYCISIYFVDKYNYNQSNRAKVVIHRV